ncbi:hypothetical protein GCM10027084_22840 [Pseudoxanthomonas sangjuensis]|nr:hypothetical protein CSC71_01975 [Pseudoxanthomonas sangjuensis]
MNEWVITDKPELAIISQEVWDAAQARQKALSNRSVNPGRHPRYLFSGFLRCPQCGGPIVAIDRYRYGCSTFKDRGPSVCSNRLRFPRADADAALLAGIKEQLLTDEAFERFQQGVKLALEQARAQDDTRARLAAAEREHENLMRAILAGIVTPATKSRLIDLENRISALRAEMASAAQSEPAQLIPRLREIWRKIVASLEDYSRDHAAAREAIRELIGERIYIKEEGGDLVAEITASSEHSDSEQPSQITVVAGAGFEPATFGL